MGGGKNTSWIDEYADFFAPTAGEAVEKRDAFIYKYMHTPVKLPKRNAVVSEGEPPAVRPKRAAAPTVRTPGLMPGAGHAGPGRGRTFEPTKLPEPSVRPTTGNWFEQRQWGAKRIAELERQCVDSNATIELQGKCIDELRQCLQKSESELRYLAEQLVSYKPVPGLLEQASHSNPFEDAILGIGYNDTQRRSLVYKHTNKVAGYIRQVTGNDSVKAKQLVELLSVRVHAGEQLNLAKTDKVLGQWRRLTEAITDSLRAYVLELHDAGGDGRYPDKIRQSMQVCAPTILPDEGLGGALQVGCGAQQAGHSSARA